MKRIFGVIFSILIMGIAMYREMQFLAIGCFTISIFLIYRNRAIELYKLGIDTIGNAHHAKLGRFEISLRDGTTLGVEDLASAPSWIKVSLPNFTSFDISNLIEVSKHEDGLNIVDPLRHSYRQLRNAGLVRHDEDTLGNSERVWVTRTGTEICNWLEET